MRRTDDRPTAAKPANGHAAPTPRTEGGATATAAPPEAGRPRSSAPPADGPHVIDPRAVYTVPAATAALALARECLPREIRLGRLQARKRAGHYWILGQWLLDWLASGAAHRSWPAGPRQG
jgi:hypothetical protein